MLISLYLLFTQGAKQHNATKKRTATHSTPSAAELRCKRRRQLRGPAPRQCRPVLRFKAATSPPQSHQNTTKRVKRPHPGRESGNGCKSSELGQRMLQAQRAPLLSGRLLLLLLGPAALALNLRLVYATAGVVAASLRCNELRPKKRVTRENVRTVGLHHKRREQNYPHPSPVYRSAYKPCYFIINAINQCIRRP